MYRSLVEQSRRRVLVFKNSHGSQGVEIVADPDRFEDVSQALFAILMGFIIVHCHTWQKRFTLNSEACSIASFEAL